NAQDAKAGPNGSNQNGERLGQGKRFKGKLRGGQAHSYSIPAGAGQFVHVVVEEKRIDVVVTLLDPSGKQVAQMQMPGRDPISIVAESSGEFRLQIVPSSNDAR